MISKLKLTLLCFIVTCLLYSQDAQSQPSINATSEKVDIRVGTDYYAKGGWHLEPNKKPDVFTIGSKWNYEQLAVSFITDIDSITIDVRPGNTYDFVIVLNNKSACQIQIVTAPNPVFMNWTTGIIIGTIFILTCLLLSQISRPKFIKYLLYLGFLIPILFWIMTLVGGSLQENYDHSRDVISELGTVGSKGEIFTSISLMILAILSLAFSIGFYKASHQLYISKTPAMLSFIKPLSLSWAAIFPLGNEFHGVLGPSPLLILVAALVAYFQWKNKNGFYKISKWSLIAGLLMLLIVLRFIPSFGLYFEGLIQRFFYFGWTIWYMMLSLKLSHKLG